MRNIAEELKSFNLSENQILKIAKNYFVNEKDLDYNYNNFSNQRVLDSASSKEENKNLTNKLSLNPKSSLLDSMSVSMLNDFSSRIILDTAEAVEENSYYIASTNIKKLDSIFDKKISDENLVRSLQTNSGEFPGHEMEVGKVNKEIFYISTNNGTGASVKVDHYFIKNRNITPINLEPSDEEKIIKKLKQLSKKTSYLISNEINPKEIKGTGIYEVEIYVVKEGEGSCCPSGMIKYRTTDFRSIIPDSLFYRDGKKKKWILVN